MKICWHFRGYLEPPYSFFMPVTYGYTHAILIFLGILCIAKPKSSDLVMMVSETMKGEGYLSELVEYSKLLCVSGFAFQINFIISWWLIQPHVIVDVKQWIIWPLILVNGTPYLYSCLLYTSVVYHIISLYNRQSLLVHTYLMNENHIHKYTKPYDWQCKCYHCMYFVNLLSKFYTVLYSLIFSNILFSNISQYYIL